MQKLVFFTNCLILTWFIAINSRFCIFSLILHKSKKLYHNGKWKFCIFFASVSEWMKTPNKKLKWKPIQIACLMKFIHHCISATAYKCMWANQNIFSQGMICITIKTHHYDPNMYAIFSQKNYKTLCTEDIRLSFLFRILQQIKKSPVAKITENECNNFNLSCNSQQVWQYRE